jgi:hypothetical protein
LKAGDARLVKLFERIPRACLAYYKRFKECLWFEDVLTAAIKAEPEEAEARGCSLPEKKD